MRPEEWSGGVHAAEGDRRVVVKHGGLEAAAPAVAFRADQQDWE